MAADTFAAPKCQSRQRPGCTTGHPGFFMPRGAQMKLLLMQRVPRAASRGKAIPYSIALTALQEEPF